MSEGRWKEVSKFKPCPACGKADWCAWTPDGAMLKCERVHIPPPGMVLVKKADGGGLFKHPPPASAKALAGKHDGGANGTRPTAPKPLASSKGRAGRIVATYPYRDNAGALLYEVVRFEPKTFRQRRPDGKGGWTWSLGDTPRVLYRLPELLTAGPAAWVFVCEGEKAVDGVRGLSLTATCNPGGAGKWARLADDSALHGRRVAILPDCDKPGRKHAEDVAARLHGKAADVRIVDLGNVEGFKGKDVSDWLDWLDSREPEDLAQALMDMAAAARAWTPGDVGEDVPISLPSPVLVCMADVKPEPVRWLWPSRIALGKLTLIAGDPGLGKSFLTLDMAARVSTGTGWPDAPEVRATRGGVVLLSAEDDAADTIRPRLDAAYADVERVMLLQAIRETDLNGNPKERAFNLAEDLEVLERAIDATDGCRFVIVDPISAYLGKTDSHKNAEVRAVLAPLGELAARCGVAVVAVTHLRKGEGVAIYRAMASLAFVAAARAVFAAAFDPQDESRARRFLVPVKNNLGNDGDALAYRLLGADGEIPHIAWEKETVKVDVDELLSGQVKRPGPAPQGRDEAAEWLGVELANGPRSSQELFREARKEGISKRTLQRAKRVLGVVARKTRFDGEWTWELPEGRHEAHQPLPETENLALLGEPGGLRGNPNKNAGSEASEMPSEDEECQERQVP